MGNKSSFAIVPEDCCLTDEDLSKEPDLLEDLRDVQREDPEFAASNMYGDEYRNYADSARQAIVENAYRMMHINQTYDFVMQQHANWLKFDKGEFTVQEVIQQLDSLVDDSDPDVDIPNSIHDFQTAERIREKWPEHDWFHLVGWLHDLGKAMALA